MRGIKGLKAEGFDLSRPIYDDATQTIQTGAYVGCSQCEALVINGLACHETGCPNQTYECKGCDAEVSRPGAYCQDCQ